MADGIERVNVVETYGTGACKPQEMNLAPDKSHFRVEGRRFSRHIFRREQRHDILLEQKTAPDVTYVHEGVLPVDATNSVNQLCDAINEQPPEGHDIADNSWYRVARSISEFAETLKLLGGEPLAFFGDEAFGTVNIIRPSNRWRYALWGFDLDAIDNATLCGICNTEVTVDDDHSTIGFLCGHVYHKRHIFPWIWVNEVHDDEENGFQALCLTCGKRLC